MRVKKGLFIHGTSDTLFLGVEKKIQSQIKVLSQQYDIHEIIVEKEKTNLIKSIIWRLPFGSYARKYDKILDHPEYIENCDFIYIRDEAWDRKKYHFISKIREINKSAKLLVEIATYPYTKELLTSFSMWPYFLKDRFYRRYAKSVIDRIVTYSQDSQIFGVPTIRVMNGVTVDDYNYYVDKTDEVIDLVAVASMRKVHGYERIIEGLNDYKKTDAKRIVKLHLVGDGPCLKKYKKLTKKYGLEDWVIFYGNKTGKELDEIFKNADIGLGSLNYHLVSSNLKIREYLAYGIPVISSCYEDIFLHNPNSGFYMKIPNDKSHVSVQTIIEYYDTLSRKYNGNKGKMREEIHLFAEKNVDMKIVMMPIVEYIG